MNTSLTTLALVLSLGALSACGKKPVEESKEALKAGKSYVETCIRGVLYVRPTFNHTGSDFTPVYTIEGKLTPCTEVSQ